MVNIKLLVISAVLLSTIADCRKISKDVSDDSNDKGFLILRKKCTKPTPAPTIDTNIASDDESMVKFAKILAKIKSLMTKVDHNKSIASSEQISVSSNKGKYEEDPGTHEEDHTTEDITRPNGIQYTRKIPEYEQDNIKIESTEGRPEYDDDANFSGSDESHSAQEEDKNDKSDSKEMEITGHKKSFCISFILNYITDRLRSYYLTIIDDLKSKDDAWWHNTISSDCGF